MKPFCEPWCSQPLLVYMVVLSERAQVTGPRYSICFKVYVLIGRMLVSSLIIKKKYKVITGAKVYA